MAHERKEIRDALVAQLAANVSLVAGRVSASRKEPHRKAELPAAVVYTTSEQVDPESRRASPQRLTRNLVVTVSAYAEADSVDELDEVLDAIALEIETAVDLDDTLGGKAGFIGLSSTETAVGVEGTRPTGELTMTFDVVYETTLRSPPPADNFNAISGALTRVDGTTDINAADRKPIGATSIHQP